MDTPGTASEAPTDFLAGVHHGRSESAFREVSLRLRIASLEEQLAERSHDRQDDWIAIVVFTVLVTLGIVLAGVWFGGAA